eukprot:3952599-Pyramimonas_sp.AAC.1
MPQGGRLAAELRARFLGLHRALVEIVEAVGRRVRVVARLDEPPHVVALLRAAAPRGLLHDVSEQGPREIRPDPLVHGAQP